MFALGVLSLEFIEEIIFVFQSGSVLLIPLTLHRLGSMTE